MLFRQLFDRESCTYTYLLADAGEAVLIDPVDTQLEGYLQLLRELNLQLRQALDTHVHADHVTALGALRKATGCITQIGIESGAACASEALEEGKRIAFGAHHLTAWYTPGHTNDSYSFLLTAADGNHVFTGDTLLIRGTGRTDFQNGDAGLQYASLMRLFTLSPDTWLHPGHDYKGWTLSTLGEERAHNPRLQVADVEAYKALMASLQLGSPKLMDVAVPANLACGQRVPAAGH